MRLLLPLLLLRLLLLCRSVLVGPLVAVPITMPRPVWVRVPARRRSSLWTLRRHQPVPLPSVPMPEADNIGRAAKRQPHLPVPRASMSRRPITRADWVARTPNGRDVMEDACRLCHKEVEATIRVGGRVEELPNELQREYGRCTGGHELTRWLNERGQPYSPWLPRTGDGSGESR